MNNKIIFIFILSTVLGGCGQRSMQEQIVGRWEITKCDFSAPTDTSQGLWKDYYQLNIGRIVEFKKDGTSKWDEQKVWQPYTINSADSGIYYKKDTIWIQSISGNTLVIMEMNNYGVLLTTHERLPDKN